MSLINNKVAIECPYCCDEIIVKRYILCDMCRTLAVYCNTCKYTDNCNGMKYCYACYGKTESGLFNKISINLPYESEGLSRQNLTISIQPFYKDGQLKINIAYSEETEDSTKDGIETFTVNKFMDFWNNVLENLTMIYTNDTFSIHEFHKCGFDGLDYDLGYVISETTYNKIQTCINNVRQLSAN